MTESVGIGIKYPVYYDFKKTKQENMMEIKWVEKLHKTFHENFKNVVQEFGSHFNVRF
jgi:hypothetical protein